MHQLFIQLGLFASYTEKLCAYNFQVLSMCVCASELEMRYVLGVFFLFLSVCA